MPHGLGRLLGRGAKSKQPTGDDDHGNCTKWLTDRFYPEQDFRAWVTTFNFIMASSLFHDVLTPQQ